MSTTISSLARRLLGVALGIGIVIAVWVSLMLPEGVEGQGASVPATPTLGGSGGVSVEQGGLITTTVSLKIPDGITETFILSASGFPSGILHSIFPTSCAATCEVDLMISAASETPTGSSTITVTAESSNLTLSTQVTLLIHAPADIVGDQGGGVGGGGSGDTGGSADGGGAEGGCFIATAAYGSYLDPHVQRLREFRDHSLLTSPAGQAFVAFYYQRSPPIANFIREHENLRTLTRWLLTPVVLGIEYPSIPIVFAVLMAGTLISLRARRKRLQEKMRPWSSRLLTIPLESLRAKNLRFP